MTTNDFVSILWTSMAMLVFITAKVKKEPLAFEWFALCVITGAIYGAGK